MGRADQEMGLGRAAKVGPGTVCPFLFSMYFKFSNPYSKFKPVSIFSDLSLKSPNIKPIPNENKISIIFSNFIFLVIPVEEE